MYLTLPMFGIVSQFFAAATVYKVWLPGILSWFPWLTLPVFFLLLIGVGVIGMLLVYKFISRSYYEFQNTQQFPEDGPVMKGIRKAVREEIEAALKDK